MLNHGGHLVVMREGFTSQNFNIFICKMEIKVVLVNEEIHVEC